MILMLKMFEDKQRKLDLEDIEAVNVEVMGPR
jgi:hypothetical protein